MPRKTPTDKLDALRREAIIRAGWDGDEALRAALGSYEQAVWEIRACARDPSSVHAYASFRANGKRDQSSWQPEIDKYRALWSSSTIAAVEGEAQNGLNDVFLGDPYPIVAVLKSIRQNNVQALGAALSRRNWHDTETVYNQVRDGLDVLIQRLEKQL